MSLRISDDEKIKLKTKEFLKSQPKYLTRYYESMGIDKTDSTKYVYLCNVVKFLKYVDENYEFFNYTNASRDKSYTKIDYSVVNGYLMSIKGLSKDTIYRNFYAIKTFFGYLQELDLIQKNPCDKIKLPRKNDEHRIVAMEKNEVKLLIDKIEKDIDNFRPIEYLNTLELEKLYKTKAFRLYVLISILTGMRISTVLQIESSDINFINGVLTVVEKGDKKRDIILGDILIDEIEQFIDFKQQYSDKITSLGRKYFVTDILFQSSRNNSPMCKDIIEDTLAAYTKDFTEHITPHKLRSTFATRLYAETGDIYLVSKSLGHSSVSTTMRYTQLSKEKEINKVRVMESFMFD